MLNLLLQFISPAHAQDPAAPNWRNISLPDLNNTFNNDIHTIIIRLAEWLLGAVGVLAVVAIVYSGIMYMTAGANTDQADKAKKNLTWAIIGLFIAVSAFLIVNIITNELNSLPH